jgi:hypothetical protein
VLPPDLPPAYDHPHLFTRPDDRTPRFITYQGVEAPKAADLTGDVKQTVRECDLPMHAKDVCGSTNIRDGPDSLAELPHQTKDDDAAWEKAARWTYDISQYDALLSDPLRMPCRRNGFSRLGRKDIRRLLQVGRLIEMSPDEIRAEANFFWVPEWSKHRRRPITEPLCNDLLTRTDLAGIHLPQQRDVRQMMARAKYVALLDASAFYDQFGLTRPVSALFGCRSGGFAQATLPMGFKPAADLAHLSARRLLDFPL